MEMKIRQMSTEDMTAFANKVKDCIADSCNMPELQNYIVVVAEKGMFGKLWDKLWGLDENTCSIRIMQEVKSVE